jgi:hypothetical protein
MWIVIWPTNNRRKFMKYLARKSIDGLFPMDMAGVFEWFAQESWAAAELTHEQPQREIWLRLTLMWALAALRSREEAEALGEMLLSISVATRLEPPTDMAAERSAAQRRALQTGERQ